MQRVLVAGTTGSGKSTLAQLLAGRLGLPYVELDSLFHGPRWVPRPEFLLDVRIFNGNTEGMRNWVDPEHPIEWAWSTHRRTRLTVEQAVRVRPELTVVQLKSHRAVRRWLAGVS